MSEQKQQPILTDFRPHVIWAIYNWMIENGYTPHIRINTAGVKLPPPHNQQETLVLNIGVEAIGSRLVIDATGIHFTCRFNQVSHNMSIPIDAVTALGTKEQSNILFLQPFSLPMPTLEFVHVRKDVPAQHEVPAKKVNHLKVIK